MSVLKDGLDTKEKKKMSVFRKGLETEETKKKIPESAQKGERGEKGEKGEKGEPGKEGKPGRAGSGGGGGISRRHVSEQLESYVPYTNATQAVDLSVFGGTSITESPGDNSTKLATTAYADAAGGGGGATTLTGDVTGSGTGTIGTTIKSSVALAGSPTTTTQAAADNSTKLATTAYVDAALPTFDNVATFPFTSQTSVTITHNNGFFTHPTVKDGSNNEIIPDNVEQTSINAFTITFSPATTGTIFYRVKGTLTLPDTISIVDEATDTTCFPIFVTASGTQTLQAKSNTGLSYDSATETLGVTDLISGGIDMDMAIIEGRQSNTVDAGTFNNGAWRTRVLNHVPYEKDTNSWFSWNSNQFTLTAGKYLVSASAPAFRVNKHKTRIQNITDATTDIIGDSAYADQPNIVQTYALLEGVLDISGTKTFELQHISQLTFIAQGLGVATSSGLAEVYSRVKIIRLGV